MSFIQVYIHFRIFFLPLIAAFLYLKQVLHLNSCGLFYKKSQVRGAESRRWRQQRGEGSWRVTGTGFLSGRVDNFW